MSREYVFEIGEINIPFHVFDNCIIYSFICKLIVVLATNTLFINTDSQTQRSSRPDTVIIRLLVAHTELLLQLTRPRERSRLR